MNAEASNGKNLAEVIAEMKEELTKFVETRIEMLKLEMREKLKTLKIALPVAALGATMLATAYLLLTLALVGLALAFLQGNPFRWFFAFLIVGAVWAVLGGIALYAAKREFEVKGLMPKRTLAVLKGDKTWVQAEVRSHI